MMSEQHLPFAEQTVQEHIPSCDQKHDWHPTIILGYFQCARCKQHTALLPSTMPFPSLRLYQQGNC